MINDSLIKEEIVSVTNGNIQKFDVISELELSNGSFSDVIKATVSITKLASFIESKGYKVEFKGTLFAENVLIQELNEKNEEKAIQNLLVILTEIQKKCFDYSIKVQDPQKNDDLWKININIEVSPNENLKNYQTVLINYLEGLSMNENEILNYNKLGKPTYAFLIAPVGLKNKNLLYLNFRNKNTLIKVFKNVLEFLTEISSFEVSNGFNKRNFSIEKMPNPRLRNSNEINMNISGNFSPMFYSGFESINSENLLFYIFNLLGRISEFSDDSPIEYILKGIKAETIEFIIGTNEIEQLGGFKNEKYGYKTNNKVYLIDREHRTDKPLFRNEQDYDDILKFNIILNFYRAFNNKIIFNYDELFTLEEIKKISEFKVAKKN